MTSDRSTTAQPQNVETTHAEETNQPPLWTKYMLVAHAFQASATYACLLGALALTLSIISVTAANTLPGIHPFDGGRPLVVAMSGSIAILLGVALSFEVGGTSPRAGVRKLALRSARLLEILGVRRTPHETLTAIWLGIAGGALAFGLGKLLMFTVTFPPSTGPDARVAAIADVSPVIGGVFLALHAAFWEETLWRGLLLLAVTAVTHRMSSRRTQLAATLILLVVTSAAFGYSHLGWSTTNAASTSIDGLIFGVLVIHQRSLWPAVIAHATMNFFVGVTVFFT